MPLVSFCSNRSSDCSWAISKSNRTLQLGSNRVLLINSIAVLLRSYTRAINIEQGRTGSLFREGTKANLIGTLKSEMIKFQNRGPKVSDANPSEEENDLQICFNYIHNNPVKAGLVIKAIDWEFSSASDIAEIRAGSLINKDLISSLGLNVVTG